MPRRDFSKVAFAATGDTNVIPTPTQPDGSISLQTGWGFDYQRDNGAGGGTPDPLAKNIDREDMNGILNEITASIGEIQQNGYPIWATSASPYPINAEVRHLDKIWQSAIINNSSTPGANSDWLDVTSSVSGQLINIRQFAVSGVYTPTAGTKSLVVQAVGGGGAGGGTAATGAGQYAAAYGGGGGAYAIGRFTTAFSGITITVGSAGVAAAGMAGTSGGASSFGALLVAPGGLGGTLGAAGGAGGVGVRDSYTSAPTGGNIRAARGVGGGAPSAFATPSVALGGQGADSFFGPGGRGRDGIRGTALEAGLNPGSGGGGGAVGPNAAATTAGGNGSLGLVIVWEFS